MLNSMFNLSILRHWLSVAICFSTQYTVFVETASRSPSQLFIPYLLTPHHKTSFCPFCT